MSKENTTSAPLKHLGFASVPAVRQYLRTAEAMELDIGEALRKAKVAPSLIKKESERITGEQFQTLIKDLIRQSRDPLLGLKSGKFVQPGSYNVLGYITMSCATLREAIALIIPYEKLVGDMGVTTLEDTGSQLKVVWNCAYTDKEVRCHMIDNVLYSWVNYSHWLANARIPPIAIHFEHALSHPSLLAEYTEAFGCDVFFNQPCSYVVISGQHLDIPLRQPDQSLRRTLEDHARTRMSTFSDGDARLVTKVKSAIRQKLNEGITRKDMVAELLEMNTRTLQRKLAAEGLSYQTLLDEVRRELAEDYLKSSALTFQEIALRIGFTEARSFHRSFKTWTGLTPGDFRAQFTK